jgi:hypothetical protein
MKRLWTPRLHSGLVFGLLLFGLAACSTVATPEPESEKPEPVSATTAPFPDLGPAPELTNEIWPNVDAPLRLSDLRGKVVAIDMWTFG